MTKEHPFLEEYQKILYSRLETLKELLQKLKIDYILTTLEACRKEIQRMASEARGFGYDKVSDLCQQLNWDFVAKIKNFYLSQPSQNWFEVVDVAVNKIEETVKTESQALQMEGGNVPKKREKKKIIVVDDDEDLLRLLDYEFHEIGFEVKNFTTGVDALSFLLKKENLQDVFLLILDRMLPDMDGLDILQKFVEQSQSQTKIPVLILSSLSSEKDIISGLQYGAIDYITKPFSIFMLMQKALNLLKTQAD